MSGFGRSKKDTERVIGVLEPGLYTGFYLKTIESKKAEKQDGSTGKHILNFTFVGKYTKADGTVVNGTFTHTEWDAEGNEKKTENQIARVEHIQKKFVDDAVLDEINTLEIESFEDYANWVVKTLPEAVRKDKKVDFKIIGNVYNNKATAGFPGYVPFIVKHGQDLILTPKEKEANVKYFAFTPVTAEALDGDLDSSFGTDVDEDAPF